MRSLIIWAILILSAHATGLQNCTQPGLKQCSACPSDAKCCYRQYYNAPGCMFANSTVSCCDPGPPLEPSTTLPNCLIIGDSVSVQYTGHVAALLKDICQVQHAPDTGAGSANNAGNGLQKLQQCRWLRTAGRPDLHVNWDVIQFNFGLHDLPKADPAVPDQLDLYTEQMDQITAILKNSGAKHVQYALTTPFQADAEDGCGPYCSAPPPSSTGPRDALVAYAYPTSTGKVFAPYPQPKNGGNGRCGPPVCKAGAPGCGVPNATAKSHSPDPTAAGCGPPTHAVTKLNQRAVGVMAKHNVSTLDLNALIHSHCGEHYTDCDLCDDETRYSGVRCGYHYSSKGIPILAQAVADSFKRLLGTVGTGRGQ